MSMSGAQASAFQAAAGFSPTPGYVLFSGFAVAVTFLWGAWAIYSCYRGWAKGKLDRDIAVPSAVRIALLCMILTVFVLS